jgi:hypothetical protein
MFARYPCELEVNIIKQYAERLDLYVQAFLLVFNHNDSGYFYTI